MISYNSSCMLDLLFIKLGMERKGSPARLPFQNQTGDIGDRYSDGIYSFVLILSAHTILPISSKLQDLKYGDINPGHPHVRGRAQTCARDA